MGRYIVYVEHESRLIHVERFAVMHDAVMFARDSLAQGRRMVSHARVEDDLTGNVYGSDDSEFDHVFTNPHPLAEFACPICRGVGLVGYMVAVDDIVERPCPHCGGSGEDTDHINTWLAMEQNKEVYA